MGKLLDIIESLAKTTGKTQQERVTEDFPVRVYHGTDTAEGIDIFDPDSGMFSRMGTGTFVADNPIQASTYGKAVMPLQINDTGFARADFNGNWDEAAEDAILYLPDGKEIDIAGFNTDEVARLARSEGVPGVRFDGITDLGPRRYPGMEDAVEDYMSAGDYQYAIFDPAKIKGRFAAGDPAKKGTGEIMASVGGLGAAAGLSSEEAEAGVVGSVRKNIDEVLIQGQDADRGLGSLPGASGRTFKKQVDETIARVYDNLRTQKDQYDEPVFDELPVGKLSGKTGRSGVTGVTRYRMPEGYSGSLEKLGRAAPDLIEIAPDADGAKYFSDQITSAKKANKFGASVYVYPQKEYKDMRLFITDDGSAGYALKSSGDVVSAFSSGTHKGVAQNILLHAVEQGGVKLDAYDTVLPDLYSTMGFRESGRIPWLDEAAPEDWNKAVFRAFNAGEPDVSFMAYSRDPAIPVEPRYESSLDAAIDAQDRDVETFGRSPLLNIINSGGAAGLGAAAMLSPEEAQAMGVKNIATEGIRSLGQTLEFDPRFDPRKREQEGLQSLRADFLPRNQQIIKPPLRLSDLEGEDFVTSMSDRTRAGGMIIGINDVPLYRAVDMRGGQDFMFENPNQVWASAKVPSEKILEMARELQGQSGKDPLFIPWRMAPTGGDFSNMVGELMLGFASSNMNKTTKKALDSAIKKYRTKGTLKDGVRKNAGLKIKEWPGVDDPRAVEIWRSTPDVVRKELMNMMDVEFRNKGGLSIGSARLVSSDPTQLMSRDAGLQNVGRIYTGRDITPSTHPSYPYAVPGEGVGALKGADEVTIFDLLPEARFGDAQKKVKDPANPTAQEIRALQMKPYGGTITENILRRIEERGVDVNSLAGLTPGALAFTLTSAGLLTPDEAAAGGLDEVSEFFGSTKGGMGVKSKKSKDDVALKAAPKKESPGVASLAGQLGLGAMSEIGGAILGGAAGVGEYLRGSRSPIPATAQSIRDANEGVSDYVGGLYDAGPEAQVVGQEIMQGIGETIAPIAEYAMEGPIMDERGLNMLPLIAQKLGIPAYQLAEMLFNKLPEREQEAAISASDVFL